MNKVLEWVCMLGGVLGALILAFGVPEAYLIFIVGSIAGTLHAYRLKLTQLMILNICFTVCNLLGIYNQLL